MIDHFLFYKQNDPDISNPIEPQLLLQDKNIFLKKLARWPKYLCVCWIGEFEPEMLLSLNSSCERYYNYYPLQYFSGTKILDHTQLQLFAT